jgi:hypothetical protein
MSGRPYVFGAARPAPNAAEQKMTTFRLFRLWYDSHYAVVHRSNGGDTPEFGKIDALAKN